MSFDDAQVQCSNAPDALAREAIDRHDPRWSNRAARLRRRC
jgi:hypothetical protein